MLKTIAKKFQRFRPESASVRNVLKLAGGTAGSQVIAVAAAPILTRLYGPESFGVLATFASILGLLNVVSSLRYELAIALPEDDDDAIILVWLCFVLVGISTALTALGVALLGGQLVGWLQQPQLKPLLWFLPLGVLLNGIYQPLSYWAIRRRQFGLLARSKFSQSIFGVMTSLAIAPLGNIGLILGQIVSQGSAFIPLLRRSVAMLGRDEKDMPGALLKKLRQYSHFAAYSSPAGVVNMIGIELPTLVFASAFGAANVGELAIAQRLVLLPVGIVGSSVSQVFLAQASCHWRLGSLGPFVRKAGLMLLAMGIFLSLSMTLVVAPAALFILGKQWVNVSHIIPMLSPLLIGQLTISTLSMAFIVSENNQLELLSQFAQAILRLGILIAAVLAGLGFEISVLAFSAGSFLGYACYGFILHVSLEVKQK